MLMTLVFPFGREAFWMTFIEKEYELVVHVGESLFLTRLYFGTVMTCCRGAAKKYLCLRMFYLCLKSRKPVRWI